MHHHRPAEDAVERRHHRHDRTTEAGDERPGGEEHERREHTDQRGHDEESDRVGEREATDLEAVVALQSSHRVVRRQRSARASRCGRPRRRSARPRLAPMIMVADTNRIAGSSSRHNRAGGLVPRPSSAGSVALGTARRARISTPAGFVRLECRRSHEEPTTTRGRRCHIPDERSVLADESAPRRRRSTSKGDPMQLAVFGANGPTGRLLTRLALDEHHDVVAFTRHPDAFPLEHPHLEVVGRRRPRRGRRRRRDRRAPTRCSRPSACRSPRRRSASTRTASPTSSPGMHAAGIKRFVGVSSSAVGPASRAARRVRLREDHAALCRQQAGQDRVRRHAPDGVDRVRRATSRGRSSARRGCSRRRRLGVQRRDRSHRVSLHRPDRPGRLPAAPSPRATRTCASTIAVATPSAKPSMVKLIWQEGHPQEVMTPRIPTHDPMRFTGRVWDAHRPADARSRVPHAVRPPRRRGRRAGGVRSTGPRRHRPHRRPRGLAGRRHDAAVPRPAAERAAGARPIRSTSPAIPSTRTRSTRRVRSTLVDNVTLAMHALLERLSPAERTSFVLHDVFQYSVRRRRDHRRAQPRRVPSTGEPGAPDAARRVGGRPLPGRLRAATRAQRAIHRGVHRWRSRRAAGAARPAVDGAGDVVPVVAVGAADVAPGILRYLGRTGVADAAVPAGRRSGRHRRAARPPRARAGPVDDRERARRPRRRVGRSRPARRRERSPRPALTEPAVRAAAASTRGLGVISPALASLGRVRGQPTTEWL